MCTLSYLMIRFRIRLSGEKLTGLPSRETGRVVPPYEDDFGEKSVGFPTLACVKLAGIRVVGVDVFGLVICLTFASSLADIVTSNATYGFAD